MRPIEGWRRWVGLGMAAGLGWMMTGCHREAEKGAAVVLPAATVRAQAVSSGTHRATEEVVGTVRARVRAVIEAKVSGRITALPVVPGQKVSAGDVLVELDAQEILARAEQARAVLAQAERELGRYKTLLKNEAVTQAEFDAVEARQRVAKASASEAETMLGYIRVAAPFGGVVARKLAEVGDLAAPGRPLLELEDPRSLRFEADLPVMLVDRVKRGDTLAVALGNATEPVSAVVGEIEPTADPVSRTVRVKLDLPEGVTARAGLFGRVSVPSAEAPILTMPATALVVRGQLEYAYVATNGQAQLRIVRAGKRLGKDVEILAGLDPGERVVVEGAGALVDGQPLTESR